MLGPVAHHDAVELLVAHLALVGFDLFLERIDGHYVLALLFVPLFLGELLDGLVELLVLFLALLFLELGDSLLLLEQPRFHLPHVLVSLEHLGEEVVRPADWHL